MALHLLAALLLPWAAAPLAALLGRRAGIGVAVATAFAQIGLTLLASPEDLIRIGGVTLVISPLARLFLPIFLVTVIAACLFSDEASDLFVPGALLVTGSITGMVMVDNPFLASLFLELAGVIGLFLLPRRVPRAGMATVGAKYLSLTVISAILLLAAFSLIENYRIGGQSRTVAQIVLALLAIGVGLRLAVFPFHLWLPSVAEIAAPPAVVLLCAVVNVSALLLLIQTFAIAPWLLQEDHFRSLLAGGAAIGAAFGGLLAIFQRDLRRLVAYATTAEIGITAFGLSWATEASVTAALAASVAHILGLLLLWLTIDQLEHRAGAGLLGVEHGLARPLPVTAIGFLVGGLTVAGFPALAAFPSRWLIGRLAADASTVWSILIILASGLILFAYLRAFRSLFLGPPPEAIFKPESRMANLAVIALAAVSLVIGLVPSPVLDALRATITGMPFLK